MNRLDLSNLSYGNLFKSKKSEDPNNYRNDISYFPRKFVYAFLKKFQNSDT